MLVSMGVGQLLLFFRDGERRRVGVWAAISVAILVMGASYPAPRPSRQPPRLGELVLLPETCVGHRLTLPWQLRETVGNRVPSAESVLLAKPD